MDIKIEVESSLFGDMTVHHQEERTLSGSADGEALVRVLRIAVKKVLQANGFTLEDLQEPVVVEEPRVENPSVPYEWRTHPAGPPSKISNAIEINTFEKRGVLKFRIVWDSDRNFAVDWQTPSGAQKQIAWTESEVPLADEGEALAFIRAWWASGGRHVALINADEAYRKGVPWS